MSELKSPVDDGLYIPVIGEWSRDKHYFLSRYINAFTTSMKNKNWSGLHYIDIFAGAGIERLKDSGELDWGSPMIAAQSHFPFARLHLCEQVAKKYNALKKRVSNIKPESQILQGDANEKICDIIKEIPEGSLSLAFLDPYGLHLEFNTIEILSDKRADLIIFFPDHLDALRNWECHYLDNPDSNLDRCLGKGADWRSLLAKAAPQNRVEVLRQLYEKQLREILGYKFFEYERIAMKGHFLYRLIFCSRNEFAAKLWRGISNKKPGGQRTFDFP